jgi:hypothetical protein
MGRERQLLSKRRAAIAHALRREVNLETQLLEAPSKSWSYCTTAEGFNAIVLPDFVKQITHWISYTP